jgi:hypothetical protein
MAGSGFLPMALSRTDHYSDRKSLKIDCRETHIHIPHIEFKMNGKCKSAEINDYTIKIPQNCTRRIHTTSPIKVKSAPV